MKPKTTATEKIDAVEIFREPMNQAQFDQKYGRRYEKKQTVFESIKSRSRQYYEPFTGIRPFGKAVVNFIPILEWLPKYNLKEDILSDIIGGLTIGIMHVPMGIAYSSISGVEAVYGLYSSFFPVLFYMFFGKCKQSSIGAFAVIALMSGFAQEEILLSAKNYTTTAGVTPIQATATLVFAMGVVQVCFAVFRLEFLTTYFCDPLVSAFTTASALHVLIAQIPPLLGIVIGHKDKGYGYLGHVCYDIVTLITSVHHVAAIISFVTMLFIYIGKEYVSVFLKKRFNLRIPLPYELVAVIITVILSQFLKFKENYGLAVVNKIPTGFPMPTAPVWELMPKCLLEAIPIGVVAIALHISVAKMLAKKYEEETDVSQELYAIGFTSVLCGFFPTYPVCTGLSRTMVSVSCGTKTQFHAIFSCLLLLSVILLIGPLLEPLPMCTLAAIIIVALRPMFQKYDELIKYWNVSKVDFLIWVVTFFATVCINVMEGLVVGIAFSLISVIWRAQWPVWHHHVRASEGDQVDICVFRFDAPLIFTCVDRFKNSVRLSIERWKQVKLEGDFSDDKQFALEMSNEFNICRTISRKRVSKEEGVFHAERPLGFQQLFILDCSPISFMDYMGACAFKEVCKEIKSKGLEVFVIGVKPDLRLMMEKCDFHSIVPLEQMFPTLRDAIGVADGYVAREEV